VETDSYHASLAKLDTHCLTHSYCPTYAFFLRLDSTTRLWKCRWAPLEIPYLTIAN